MLSVINKIMVNIDNCLRNCAFGNYKCFLYFGSPNYKGVVQFSQVKTA